MWCVRGEGQYVVCEREGNMRCVKGEVQYVVPERGEGQYMV